MTRPLYYLVFLFLPTLAFSQTASDLGVWLDHLPYANLIDVHAEADEIYCAAEQGLLIYNQEDKSLDRLSKVNGLSDIGLTTLGWSDKHRVLFIGYENGNMDMLDGREIRNIGAIKQSGSYSGLKRVNKIVAKDDLAYICTNFGIVTYDIPRDIILETLIIGAGGEVLRVNDVAISDDSIYAATENGVMAAQLDDDIFIFESWSRLNGVSGEVIHIENFEGKIVVSNTSPAPVYDSVFVRENGGWRFINELPDSVLYKDMRAEGDQLSIVTGSAAQSYTTDYQLNLNVQTGALEAEGIPTKPASLLTLNAASIGKNINFYWVVSNDGLFASIRYDGVNSYAENIQPNSPATSSVIKMYHNNERLFVAPGGINSVYSPVSNNDGYFELKDYQWTNHSNSEFRGFKDIVAFISDPEDPAHVYASSYGSGILEFQNLELVRFIHDSTTNNAFPTIAGTQEHRVGGFSADPEGNIWFTNNNTDKPLGVIRPEGTVESFSLGSAVGSSLDIKDILYTSQDQIWIQTRGQGVVVVQVSEGGQLTPARLSASEGSGDLPSGSVLTFAEDQDGEVWIGTNEGMAVFYSPQNIFDPERNYDAQIIVIDEDGDGNGERVLGSEQINDIEVDGSNKKWFATASSGVFYTSENGKEQIYNFNTSNSPLPSNNVIDIEIDDITGMVYFGTDQGIVSFQGGATEGVITHTDVFAYPNPVKPDYNGPILIRGLVTNAQVKITDIEGNIVFETVAEGGQAIWSGKNFSGERARSGVYLAYITNDDGTATAVTKILIVN